ncbi:unnamed protein product [Meganyctiphanes norvegica]|uniref:EGF-like domain-containing protein n=1 Tax=Meganyctiphanes norvegica TaxID=48144 RepID=A0AAV2RLN6_MEGNR
MNGWSCYIDDDPTWQERTQRKHWEHCTGANAATERRCTSNGVTRHIECDINDDEGYCCSESGWCGNTKDHCKSPGRNLREEACSGIACGENGECFWDEGQKKTYCRCKENYHYDSSTEQCQECVGNSNCQHYQACFSGTCHSVCDGACATGAQCTPQNHEATCTCNVNLVGNPYSGKGNSGCHQCLSDDDCQEDKKCSDDKNCIDPCLNYCKPDNVTCTVKDHSPLCTCPKDLKPATETLCQFIADEAADPYVTKVLLPVIFSVILLLVFIAICL